ncbi:hypothetical protein HOP50_17g79550 [Chloropicon primus]|uniref:Uncharacterized protein n=1 Tax=Chloropicon primus TaxID=1764295 RepID=A0A5B8N0V7_9CHLO|nr:hypothetical protein A3770_17p79320 [Chloropicon primus]UPR04611.1 hypothetical protein HOP50_17g79550 [Chloropicon primus]|eukprot:QDZ25414.1 hypothetical protein A3770_17p79320 [Chloropicon primus]
MEGRGKSDKRVAGKKAKEDKPCPKKEQDELVKVTHHCDPSFDYSIDLVNKPDPDESSDDKLKALEAIPVRKGLLYDHMYCFSFKSQNSSWY